MSKDDIRKESEKSSLKEKVSTTGSNKIFNKKKKHGNPTRFDVKGLPHVKAPSEPVDITKYLEIVNVILHQL